MRETRRGERVRVLVLEDDVAVRHVREALARYLAARQGEYERQYDALGDEDAAALIAAFGDGQGKNAPVVSARFGTAAEVLSDVLRELERVARASLHTTDHEPRQGA